jgi:hypothetical protein
MSERAGVRYETAPTEVDVICIVRQLPVSRYVGLALVASALSACGGSAKPAEAPPPAPAAEAAPPPPPPKEEEPPPPEAPKGPSVQDQLATPDKAWVLNFQSSALYDKAAEQCDEKLKEKPQERAKCISKARDGIIADAFEFTKDDAGRDVWVVYRTKSSRLIKIYTVPVEFGEQKGDTLQIKKAGKATGTPPLFAEASTFDVKLTSEYSLEFEEPKFGRLAYDARLGFITVK